MKLSNNVYLFVIYLVSVGYAVAAEPPQTDQEAAEQEIRASADSFAEAFKKRDAAAIAAQWTEDGVFIDQDSQRFEGRKAIQTEYESLFKDAPDGVELRIEIDSIRFINPQTAIEEGRAALTPQPPGAERVMSRYTAVHVNQDGKWPMADVRETQVVLPPDVGRLEDLDWLVGTWGTTNKEAKVEVKIGWIVNQSFLARSHTVTESEKVTSGGFEIIGLDPSTGRITSWSFTGDGGHAVGIWAPYGDGWEIESSGVMKDGTQTSASYILSRKDKDTLSWKSGNRTVGYAPLPDTEEVTLKRK